MLHRLCEPPSIPLGFSLAAVLPRRGTYCVSYGRKIVGILLLSAHRLRLGLQGYLIPFATLAFAPQRQLWARESLSPPAFLLISTHFTAPPRVPLSPPTLEQHSIGSTSPVEPGDFTTDLRYRLRALYAQWIRTTLATSVLPRLLAQS